jgi:hypothetical protein
MMNSSSVLAIGRGTPAGIQLLGTAFALNRHGFFATSYHVVGQSDKDLVLCFKTSLFDGEYQDSSDLSVRTFPAQISAVDTIYDLVILKSGLRLEAEVNIVGADAAPVGTMISTFGFPHADHGRLVLTRQDTEVGARVLISSSGIKAKHLILNIQARPGQSGSPIFHKSTGGLVGVLTGSYAPRGGSGISLGGVDPYTLHQTTHAISAEYLRRMY